MLFDLVLFLSIAISAALIAVLTVTLAPSPPPSPTPAPIVLSTHSPTISGGGIAYAFIEAEESSFGSSIGISADKQTIIVGANSVSIRGGHAYVYDGLERGVSPETYSNMLPYDPPGDLDDRDFGTSVFISENGTIATAFVRPGADGYSFYIFHREDRDSPWEIVQRLVEAESRYDSPTQFSTSKNASMIAVGMPNMQDPYISYYKQMEETLDWYGDVVLPSGTENNDIQSYDYVHVSEGAIAFIGTDVASDNTQYHNMWVFVWTGNAFEQHGEKILAENDCESSYYGFFGQVFVSDDAHRVATTRYCEGDSDYFYLEVFRRTIESWERSASILLEETVCLEQMMMNGAGTLIAFPDYDGEVFSLKRWVKNDEGDSWDPLASLVLDGAEQVGCPSKAKLSADGTMLILSNDGNGVRMIWL